MRRSPIFSCDEVMMVRKLSRAGALVMLATAIAALDAAPRPAPEAPSPPDGAPGRFLKALDGVARNEQWDASQELLREFQSFTARLIEIAGTEVVTFTNFVFENRYAWDHPHIVRR